MQSRTIALGGADARHERTGLVAVARFVDLVVHASADPNFTWERGHTLDGTWLGLGVGLLATSSATASRLTIERATRSQNRGACPLSGDVVARRAALQLSRVSRSSVRPGSSPGGAAVP